jgi:hypothetical protein
MPDLQTLANLGEFLGGVVVVLSLVYLGYQVRQNTQSLRAENYARALERVSAMQARLSSEAPLAALFVRGLADANALTREERSQLAWALYEMFGAFEFMFHQFRSGSLPAEVWERWSATLSWWLSLPGVASWWSAKPAPFSSSFSALVDERVRDNPFDRASAGRWQEFLVGAGRGSPAAAELPVRGEAQPS